MPSLTTKSLVPLKMLPVGARPSSWRRDRDHERDAQAACLPGQTAWAYAHWPYSWRAA